MAAQSQIEAEPGTGVAPFVMPSDPVIIQLGKEEAKKAVPGAPDAPTADADQAEELVEVAWTGGPGSCDTPKVEVDQADGTIDTTAASEAEELEDATDAEGHRTARRRHAAGDRPAEGPIRRR